MEPTIFCSVIIPTVGRTTLRRAVESALRQQTSAALEVIVVNDSGMPLAAEDWQQDARVRMIETQHVERSRARNAGAYIARGSYLLFLDDDDWYLPEAVELFANGARANGAPWLLGDCRVVSATEAIVGTIHLSREGNCAIQAMAGEWLPLMVVCVNRTLFFQAGGFRPIPPGEDRDLVSRLALRADLRRIYTPVACYAPHAATSTSKYNARQRIEYLVARDVILDEPNAFARLRASADTPYWRGRMVRLYAGSFLVNFRAKRLGRATARTLSAAAAALSVKPLENIGAFWRGFSQQHTTETLGADGA